MKKIKLILIFLTFLIVVSCSKNEKSFYPNLPYFEFKTEDRENLLNLPELNTRLTFVNQNKEELYFDVVKSEEKMQLYSRGNWVYGSTSYYYFDQQLLHLRSSLFDISDTHRYIEISVRKTPEKFDWRVFPVILSEESLLVLNIEHSAFSNTGPNTHINSFNNFINMTLNKKTYLKIKKIDLTTTASFNYNWPLPSLNYLYFDINEGVIGFDDRNGNEWRLK